MSRGNLFKKHHLLIRLHFPDCPMHTHLETPQNREVKFAAKKEKLCRGLAQSGGARGVAWRWGISMFQVPGVLDSGIRGSENQKTERVY